MRVTLVKFILILALQFAWVTVYAKEIESPMQYIISVRHISTIGKQEFHQDYNHIHRYHTKRYHDTINRQDVKVLEGKTVFIQLAHLHPVLKHVGRYQEAFHAGIAYQDVSSGFVVTPNSYADKVRIKLDYQQQMMSRESAVRIEKQLFSTDILVPLGAWYSLAKIDHVSPRQESTIYTSDEQPDVFANIEIKIDKVMNGNLLDDKFNTDI